MSSSAPPAATRSRTKPSSAPKAAKPGKARSAKSSPAPVSPKKPVGALTPAALQELRERRRQAWAARRKAIKKG